MRLRVTAVLLIGLVVAATQAAANEGMYPLYDLSNLPFDSLAEEGLELSLEEIYNPDGPDVSDACVNLSGGSASFVSPNGLIVTNHHVAFGAIQRASSIDENFIRDGFYAETRADEIPAIGYTVNIVLSTEDVTDRVRAVLDDGMSDTERHDAIEQIEKEIVAAAEEGRDVTCSVASMYGGNQYMLYTYLRLRDVRIVYAPPAAIGVYGGDIDNWMWPRHTGDFSFLRAYVAPDGSPAEYSEENVPYKPLSYLPISSAGVKEGDFSMIIGFPGRTNRYAVSYVIDNLVNFRYPAMIRTREEVLDIFEAAAEDPEVAIRVASSISYLNNGLKKAYAMLDGFEHGDVLRKVRERENDLREFLQANEKRWTEYGWVLASFDSLYREEVKYREKDELMGLLKYPDYLGTALAIHKWAEQRQLPDSERDRGYQDRDSLRFMRRQEHIQINLVESVDRDLMEYLVWRALELPESQAIGALTDPFAGIADEDLESAVFSWIDSMYAGSEMGDLERRMELLAMTPAELEALGDPFLDLAIRLKPEIEAADEREEAYYGAYARLKPVLSRAYFEWRGDDLYPDANGTRRFSFGSVRPYSPQDAVIYDYLTTLTGVMEKETGEDPFIVPEELRAAWEERRYGIWMDPYAGDIPVNFLTTNDGTNGNSGSPVINGRGELIGLEFDVNYEGVANDYWYNGTIGRAIMVDIRYALFLMDQVYNIETLMNELTIR